MTALENDLAFSEERKQEYFQYDNLRYFPKADMGLTPKSQEVILDAINDPSFSKEKLLSLWHTHRSLPRGSVIKELEIEVDIAGFDFDYMVMINGFSISKQLKLFPEEKYKGKIPIIPNIVSVWHYSEMAQKGTFVLNVTVNKVKKTITGTDYQDSRVKDSKTYDLKEFGLNPLLEPIPSKDEKDEIAEE